MNSSKPLVSIITPSYQQGRFIEETILSVIGQKYSKIEHVIIDGLSTDETISIVQKYSEQNQIKWLSEKDNGQSEALNKGLNIATGEIIGWINADDTYLPGAVNAAVDTFKNNPEIDWLYGDAYWINEKGEIIGVYKSQNFNFEKLICQGMFIPQPTVFFRKSLLQKTGPLDESLSTTMDYDFCLRLGLHGKSAYIPEFLATRRIHGETKTEQNKEMFYFDAIRSLDKFFYRKDLPVSLINLKKCAYGNRHRIGAFTYFSKRDFNKSKILLKKAVVEYKRYSVYQWLSILIVYLQCLVGVHIISPGFSKRKRDRAYLRVKEKITVNWINNRGIR